MKRGGYQQYCPIAKAAGILTERWTLLVLRDLLIRGARRFNDLRRGSPTMPPSVLATRLKTLQEAGIIVRESDDRGRACEYRLTPAGEELRPLLEAAGEWGQRWLGSTFHRKELHPGPLMWDVQRKLKCEALPAKRAVIYVEFSDIKRMQRWWLVVEEGEADLCIEDPGHEIDIAIYTDLLSLTRVFLGDLSIGSALAEKKIRLNGRRDLVRSFPKWFGQSIFATQSPAGAVSS